MCNRLFGAFIDLKRAFDSVYLNGPWFKLHKVGNDAKMLRIIKDMYNKVKSCVRGCNSYSDFFDCAVGLKQGLKQGDVISPMLFSIYIEDLELFLQDDQCCGISIDDITFILMLFADDIVILGKDRHDLQKSVDRLEYYCNKWGLEVNTGKNKSCCFQKTRRFLNNEFWTYKGVNLEVVNNFNILGLCLITLALLY